MNEKRKLAAEIASEHAALQEKAREIRTELDRLRGEPGNEHRVGELVPVLLEFGQHLRRHFELEDETVEGAAGANPGTRRRLLRLSDQHRDLVHELETLQDSAVRAETGHALLSDAFVQGLRDFLTHLIEHERAEGGVVQDAIVRDVGAGD